MPIESDRLLVDRDVLSARVMFVAQIDKKIGEGRKVVAARLVRNTPVVAPAEYRVSKS